MQLKTIRLLLPLKFKTNKDLLKILTNTNYQAKKLQKNELI
jgi:hypothetical protein